MSRDRLLGTWDISMQHVALPEPVAGRQRYELVLDGAFVLLQWTYDHPDFPDAMALLDQTAFHYFDVRGISRVFDLQINEQGWSMIRRDPDFWQRSSTTFVGDRVMEGTGENSHDGGVTWEHDFVMTWARSD